MFRKFAIATVIALRVTMGASTRSSSIAGSWQVDPRHSDVQLITDATTDYGKTGMDVTLGFGRVNGTVIFDDDPAKSSVDLHLYPATSMLPRIAEDGKFRNLWLSNVANDTLVCFHSKGVTRTADGKLQTTGTMTLTRVDRSVQADPTEAYAGPVYGPPITRFASQEVTLVFDPPDRGSRRDGGIQESASTRIFRDSFPQHLKAVPTTYWPPVIQDMTCQPVSVGEDYHGIPYMGTMLQAPSLPGATCGQCRGPRGS
jgi:polyisoprenoid-binding protein YceI